MNAGDKVTVIYCGRPRRATVTRKVADVLMVVSPDKPFRDAEVVPDVYYRMEDEGVDWVSGWDPEKEAALVTAHALTMGNERADAIETLFSELYGGAMGRR